MGATTAMDRKTGQDEGAAKGAAAQRAKRLKAKNLTLVAFVVLVYFVSIVRMGGS